MGQRYISYLRVSTIRQGASGLGLEAQRAAVESFASRGDAEVLKEYVEVESGKRADRPQLQQAVRHARLAGAVLVIAKLDRLARNVHFLTGLMEAGVKFVACDNAGASDLTVHILAAVAQDEAKRISERTKAALAAYKARGGLLGASLPQCRNLSDKDAERGRALGARATREQAARAYEAVAPLVLQLRGEGLSCQAVADRLNGERYQTRTGKAWNRVQVGRVLGRLEGAA